MPEQVTAEILHADTQQKITLGFDGRKLTSGDNVYDMLERGPTSYYLYNCIAEPDTWQYFQQMSGQTGHVPRQASINRSVREIVMGLRSVLGFVPLEKLYEKTEEVKRTYDVETPKGMMLLTGLGKAATTEELEILTKELSLPEILDLEVVEGSKDSDEADAPPENPNSLVTKHANSAERTMKTWVDSLVASESGIKKLGIGTWPASEALAIKFITEAHPSEVSLRAVMEYLKTFRDFRNMTDEKLSRQVVNAYKLYKGSSNPTTTPLLFRSLSPSESRGRDTYETAFLRWDKQSPIRSKVTPINIGSDLGPRRVPRPTKKLIE